MVVWLHGGSYEKGSGPNGTGLVDFAGDIVFVAVNYRLGWAGYLGADALRSRDGASNSTGNYGLQDQRAAMTWVAANIGSFGGDPKRITIDGCSAGAGSVAAHLVSPRSWPFFHRAAGESGVMSQWNSKPMGDAELFFGLLLKAANCDGAGNPVACLEAMSASTVAAHAAAAWTARQKLPGFDGVNNYSPVVDGVELTASPRELILAGKVFPHGQLLVGTAADEVCTLEGRDYSFKLSEEAFKQDVETEYRRYNVSVNRMMELYGHSTVPFHGQPNVSCGCGSPQLAPYVCIPCKYPGRYSPYWWSVIERGSDFGFHCPTRQFSRVVGASRPVFVYSYQVLGLVWSGLYCAAHCTELADLLLSGPPDTRTPRGHLAADMARRWISFYTHGDPGAGLSVPWPDFGAAGETLIFALPDAGGVHTTREYRAAECMYWETLEGGPD